MRTSRITTALFWLALLWCTPAQSQPAGCLRPLLIAALDYPPFIDASGDSGFVLEETVTQAFLLGGCESQVVHMPFARALQLAKLGEVDALLSVWYRPDRRQYLHYGPELFSAYNVLATLDTATAPTSLEEIGGLSLGIVRGYASPTSIETNELTLVLTRDDRNSLAMLQRGRVDLVFINAAQMLYLPNRYFPAPQQSLRVIEGSEQPEGFYFAVSHKRDDFLTINTLLARGLVALNWDAARFSGQFLPAPKRCEAHAESQFSVSPKVRQCAAKRARLGVVPTAPSEKTGPTL